MQGKGTMKPPHLWLLPLGRELVRNSELFQANPAQAEIHGDRVRSPGHGFEALFQRHSNDIWEYPMNLWE